MDAAGDHPLLVREGGGVEGAWHGHPVFAEGPRGGVVPGRDGGDVAVAVVVDTVEFVIVSRTQPPPSDIGRAGSLSDTLII